MSDEERLEIECLDCGKKLVVLRIVRPIQPVQIKDSPNTDLQSYSVPESAKSAASLTVCFGEPRAKETLRF
jgi:hypothetical protein